MTPFSNKNGKTNIPEGGGGASGGMGESKSLKWPQNFLNYVLQ